MKNVLLLCALIACNKTNPNYCADHPDHNCNESVDARDHDAPASTCATAGCATGVCDTTSNTCVQCTAAQPQACSGATPVCDATDTCRPCGADAECAESGVCRVDGSCALSAAVLYASTTGGAAATCAAGDKCTLAQALTLVDATHTIVHLDPGTYAIDGITTTQNVTITGRGAIIDRSAGTIGPVFTVGAGLTASLEFVTLQGGHSATTANGITCATGELDVHAVTIQMNSGIAISSTSCDVVVARSTLYANAEGGIYLAGTTSTKFDITDSFVIHNGNNTDAMFGGIYILPQTVGTSRLEFNTIVDNQASSGVTHFGGVTCDIAAVGAANNIVARNLKGGAASGQQTQGQCGFLTSKVQDDITGLGFMSADSQPYNYRLGFPSSAIDAANTASLVDVDVDGNHRPVGAQKDIGAAEFKP
jgi:hypothetical protein